MTVIVDKAIPFMENRFPQDVEVISVAGDEISPEMVKDADALIVRTRTRCDETLLKGSKVKLVATATIGTDHIDIPWCQNNGIMVKSAPGCNAPGVAQYVLSSLFKTGCDPETHTLGIVGYGHVGSTVAHWASQLGIRILVCDPPRRDEGLDDMEYHHLAEVLQKSDAVTFHVPLTKEGKYPTRYMIGKKELEYMKPGSILVNSSRGGVVNEKALKEELYKGRIRAIIDTWENEPAIDLELLKLVEIATPHIAGYSAQGKMRGTRLVLEAVAETFNITVNTEGLQCIPDPEKKITKTLIESSYNPLLDHLSNPQSPIPDPSSPISSIFEARRNNYTYRPEPLFHP